MTPFVAGFADELVKVGAAAARSTLTPHSSNVRGFRYDPATKEMFVTFKGGGTYRYSDVPPAAARSIRRSKSVGKAVNKHLKGGGYAYEKVGALVKLGKVIMHLSGPVAAGKSTLLKSIQEEHPGLVIASIDSYYNPVIEDMVSNGEISASPMSGEEIKARTEEINARVRNKLNSFLKKNEDRPVVIDGFVLGNDDLIKVPVESRRMLDTSPRKTVWQGIRRDREISRSSPFPDDNRSPETFSRDYADAKWQRQYFQDRGYTPASADEIREEIRRKMEKVGMPATAIAKVVRRALEKDPDRVARFIGKTQFPAAKRVALDEARAFMSGTPQFAGKRAGNVLKPVSGEITTRFGAGEGVKMAALPIREWGRDMIRDIIARMLNYREERFGGQPPRRHRKHASAPDGAESIEASFRSMRKIAGVAKKQITWQGLPMKIEHEPGDIRSGKSKDGKTWERTMFDSYGYIPGTKGKAADGDAIDVYFAKDPVDGPVFKVRQLKKDSGEYDEDKFMVGFGSEENAKKAYLRHMPAWALGDISSVGKTFEDFKTFVRS